MTLRSFIAALALVALTALSADAQVGKSAGVLEANTATEAQLVTLPHLTPALAKELIAARPFLSPTAFDAFLAPKLSPAQRTALYPKLFVHLNLNAASREEIQLVPGMGARMTREFLEYRPYRSLAVFRREMAKYVNAEEVARLEQYVYVPLDINTATDEEFTSIPGLGPRMLREFKEYRPYRNIEQFRREMGKYVSAGEVTRLERYIMIAPAP